MKDFLERSRSPEVQKNEQQVYAIFCMTGLAHVQTQDEDSNRSDSQDIASDEVPRYSVRLVKEEDMEGPECISAGSICR